MNAEEFRRIGHKVIDQLAAYFDSVADKRVFPLVEPGAVDRLFRDRAPSDGASADAVLAKLDEKLYPYCTHTGSGGYLGLTHLLNRIMRYRTLPKTRLVLPMIRVSDAASSHQAAHFIDQSRARLHPI
jgi:hypothetical protein